MMLEYGVSCCRTARQLGAKKCPVCDKRIDPPVLVTIMSEGQMGAGVAVQYAGERIWITETDICIRRRHGGGVSLIPLANVLSFKVEHV